MPGKWGGGACAGRTPLDLPMKLGYEANGGARAGRAPPLDPPMMFCNNILTTLDNQSMAYHISCLLKPPAFLAQKYNSTYRNCDNSEYIYLCFWMEIYNFKVPCFHSF